jgi:hypothetical protein
VKQAVPSGCFTNSVSLFRIITTKNAGTRLNISFYHLEQCAGKYHSQELESKKSIISFLKMHTLYGHPNTALNFTERAAIPCN